jgi:hypothetical protein
MAAQQEEKRRDEWFNQARPMTKFIKMWREKCLAREEDSEGSDSNYGQ